MGDGYGVEVVSDGVNGVRLNVSGDVDQATAGHLLETVYGITPAPMHELMIDLEAVTFMDSRGLAALLEAHRHLEGRQVRLSLTNVSSVVASLLRSAGLDGYLNVDT
jgi:anti-anti-sigma factor